MRIMLSGRLQFRSEKMELRRYNSSDLKEITELFYDTVHTVNAADYTEEQLSAWASGEVDDKLCDGKGAVSIQLLFRLAIRHFVYYNTIS